VRGLNLLRIKFFVFNLILLKNKLSKFAVIAEVQKKRFGFPPKIDPSTLGITRRPTSDPMALAADFMAASPAPCRVRVLRRRELVLRASWVTMLQIVVGHGEKPVSFFAVCGSTGSPRTGVGSPRTAAGSPRVGSARHERARAHLERNRTRRL
jgi:hypothetical protein